MGNTFNVLIYLINELIMESFSLPTKKCKDEAETISINPGEWTVENLAKDLSRD